MELYLDWTFRSSDAPEAAQSMLRSKKWSWLKAWAMQIARRRGMKKATVALARRLAVICAAYGLTAPKPKD